MDFAKMLTHHREAAGLTMNQLSVKSGVSQPYIGEIEKGKKKPTIDTIERLCAALGVTLSHFFSDPERSLPNDMQQLIQTTEKLPPEERKALNEYLKIRLAVAEAKEINVIQMPVKEQEELNAAAYGGDLDGISEEEKKKFYEMQKKRREDEEFERNNPDKK
ncbi:helix-turn-helix domain-containing protein [Paenibacillus periandrae]|uniref:helix-turn-helix domain-containing protein n=1 Tax=Paenibacillus periandrae TaxID=1761741 RepID=UPI001F0904B8|nr:helix-turn-helix transcriptional regulator [Paenibacillus periandrae]